MAINVLAIRRTNVGLFGVVATLGFVGLTAASQSPRTTDAAACAAMQAATYADNTTITKATYFPSNVTIGATPVAVPFCRIEAVARPTNDSQIGFEVWLPPLGAWNTKYQSIGSGGSRGDINTGSMASPLSDGYAVMATDNGHINDRSLPNGASEQTWALGHPEKIIDFAYRAQHVSTVHAKEIVRDFYRKAASRSYFVGCSQGGHHALMEASRYPEDHDAIIAGSPAWEWFNAVTAEVWNSQMFLQDNTAIVSEKSTLLNHAVVDACDAADGVTDHVINDPRKCTFNPATLQCRGADAADCLTATQVAAANRIYGGAKRPDGKVIFPPYTRGSEFGWSVIYGTDPAGGSGFDFFRYTLFQTSAFNNKDFDFAADYNRALKVQINGHPAPEVFNATSDLSAFRLRGGKLIIYHGWADPQISPNSSIDYYDRVVKAQGVANTKRFLRLFMAPGMGHCSLGPGPQYFGGSTGKAPVADAAHDVVRALDKWSTDGTAPETLIASRVTANTVTLTRPLCAWPKAAVYKGTGSTDDASNFKCK